MFEIYKDQKMGTYYAFDSLNQVWHEFDTFYEKWEQIEDQPTSEDIHFKYTEPASEEGKLLFLPRTSSQDFDFDPTNEY